MLTRVVVCLVLLSVTLLGLHLVSLQWRNATNFQEMYGAMQSGEGYKGALEYLPAGSDPRYEPGPQTANVAAEGDPAVRIELHEWAAESKRFTAESPQPARLVLRLFNYPAWQVEVNGQVIAAETKAIAGQMVIPVDTGKNQVSVVFAQTRGRNAGTVVSALTFLFLLIYLWNRKYSPQVAGDLV